MPSSWLETDEYEVWAAEIELSEPQLQASNNASDAINQAAPHQHGNPPSTGPQQSDRPRYAGSYQPYSPSQSEADVDADPRQNPLDDINDEQQADTPQQYSSEVSDSPPVPGSANRQTGRSDIDSLFGDSDSEAEVDSPLAQAQEQNYAQPQAQSTTLTETPPPESPAPSIPRAQMPRAGRGAEGGSLLSSLFDDQGWDKEPLGGYNPKFHRREDPPQRWWEKQKNAPVEPGKEKANGGDRAKERERQTQSTQAAPPGTGEGVSGSDRAAEEETTGYDPPEDEYLPEEPDQYSYEEPAPYDSQAESDEGYGEEDKDPEDNYLEEDNYPDKGDQYDAEDFPGEAETTKGKYHKSGQDTTEENNQESAQDGTTEQDQPSGQDHPETTDSNDMKRHPPEWFLLDHHPWAYLRDAYNPDDPTPNADPAAQPSGFAQYASRNTWDPPPRQLSPEEHYYARLLYFNKIKAQGRNPSDPSQPWRDRSKDPKPEPTESDEELEWVQTQMEQRREENQQYLGTGGPRDQSLWTEEQKKEREEELMGELLNAITEKRERKKREKEREAGEEAGGKDAVDGDSDGGDEVCECPCEGLASKCTCHPLYCPCLDCDHTEQAEQLRKEAERKWGEGQAEVEVQQAEEAPKAHGSCCGEGKTQKKCSCLPGLCSCDGCEEHDVGRSDPTASSQGADPWPQIPASQRLFHLEQQVPSERHACGCRAGGDCLCQSGRCNCGKAQSAPGPQTRSTQDYPAHDSCPCRAGGQCRCQPGKCRCSKAQTAPEPRRHPTEVVPSPTFLRSATWTPSHASRPLHLKLSELIETPAAGSTTPLGTPPLQSGGNVHPTTAPQFSRQNSVPPSRPDTPRPPVDSTPSIPYAADVMQEYGQQGVEPELTASEQRFPQPSPERHVGPPQSVGPETTPLNQDGVRQSVEPEYPPPNWERDTTPAYEDRSFTPSPLSQPGDVEMRDASGSTIVPSAIGREVSVPPSDTEDQRPTSPRRPVPPPIPDTPIQQPKRGDKRKSGVQGGKIDKRSATGSKAKPKSRNVTRKPTQSVGKLVEKAKKESEEAVEEAEAGPSVLKTPTKPPPKAGGKVAEAVKKIEKQVQQQEEKEQKQKDGTPVRRSGRANKGVRTSLGYGTP